MIRPENTLVVIDEPVNFILELSDEPGDLITGCTKCLSIDVFRRHVAGIMVVPHIKPQNVAEAVGQVDDVNSCLHDKGWMRIDDDRNTHATVQSIGLRGSEDAMVCAEWVRGDGHIVISAKRWEPGLTARWPFRRKRVIIKMKVERLNIYRYLDEQKCETG